jgi:hypothetical protein
MQLRPPVYMAEVKQLPIEATVEIAKFVAWLITIPISSSSWVASPAYGLLRCSDADMKTKLEPLCVQLVIT